MSERAEKPLEIIWSKQALRDLDKIEEHYLKESGERLADEAVDAIYWQAGRIAELRLKFRPGENNTRECVLKQFPYTLVYRLSSARMTVVRVLHQRRAYFNR